MQDPIFKAALTQALLTLLYISLVASFMFYGTRMFGENKEDSVLMPVSMLLLFVLSAGITSSLVFGRSVLWYLDGKKQEAVSLLIRVFGFLFLFVVLAFIGILLTS